MKRIPKSYTINQLVNEIYSFYFKESYFYLNYGRVTMITLPKRFNGEEVAKLLNEQVEALLKQPDRNPQRFDITGASNVLVVNWYEKED